MEIHRLMAAIHDDDAMAFRDLYEEYVSELRFGVRCFLRKVPRLIPHEDDIMSRAWLRLLARDRKWLRAFDPQRGTFTNFMRMAGVNTAWQVADLKSHPSRWLDAPAFEASDDAEEDLETLVVNRDLLEEASRRLEQALSARERLILEKVIVLKRSAPDIARELGISSSAVWTATTRLRQKIAPLLEDLRDEVFGRAPRTTKGSELLLLFLVLGADLTEDPAPSVAVSIVQGGRRQ